jgi:AmmeMemoRadiSam system protein B
VRSPAVAGTFYPGDPRALAAAVDGLLRAAGAAEGPAPKAIVVPHAGYAYSGAIAARAFAALGAAAGRIRRVVLLGPAHRVPLRGMAVPAAERFATPLGTVPIDHEAAAQAGVPTSEPAHRLEHSLEVEVPFLQRLLSSGFTLVPVVVGDTTPAEVGRVLEALWNGPETLVVVSSDLSHYLPYDIARATDAETARIVLALDVDGLSHDRACGASPLTGLLWVARRKGLRPVLLDLRNSGDTSGDHDGGVVGYGAFAFHE